MSILKVDHEALIEALVRTGIVHVGERVQRVVIDITPREATVYVEHVHDSRLPTVLLNLKRMPMRTVKPK